MSSTPESSGMRPNGNRDARPERGKDKVMKLDFLVAGFGKCGTTSLCAALAEHPGVFIPKEKETAFFAFYHYRGWPWYENFFRDARPAQISGEGSQFYSCEMFETLSCQRIFEYAPDLRLIFIARDPIARLESYYRELHHSGHVVKVNAPYTIAETLAAFPHMVTDTLYWQRINTYRSCAADERIHVLFLEDLAARPEVELARCFEFLGVDPSEFSSGADRRLNSGSRKLYDSRLMRMIRTRPWLDCYWKRLPIRWQNRFGRATGLRRPFRKGPVEWDEDFRDRVLDTLARDVRQFLEFYGKPAGFWGQEYVDRTEHPTRAAAA